MAKVTDWRFVLKNAWRRQGPPSWSRDYTPRMTFVAQSNAEGFLRLLGLGLSIAADIVYDRISAPLLHRGMKGQHLGVDAKRYSLTWLAWRGAGITNDFRGWLEQRANELARYNR